MEQRDVDDALSTEVPDVPRQVLSLIALTVVLVVNTLANTLPIAGKTTGEISDAYPNAFAPAGYAFSIWSLIYAGLIAYAIYQMLPQQRKNPRLAQVAPLFWLSCAANVAWIFCWHYQRITASLVVMAVLLASLASIYRVLHRGREPASAAEIWCVHVPFSLYFGWITVATVANTTIWGVYAGVEPVTRAPEAWAITMIALATLVAGVVGWAKRDPIYVAPFAWAFIGVIVRQGIPSPVSTAAIGAFVIVSAVLLRALYLNRGHVEPVRIHAAPRGA